MIVPVQTIASEVAAVSVESVVAKAVVAPVELVVLVETFVLEVTKVTGLFEV